METVSNHSDVIFIGITRLTKVMGEYINIIHTHVTCVQRNSKCKEALLTTWRQITLFLSSKCDFKSGDWLSFGIFLVKFGPKTHLRAVLAICEIFQFVTTPEPFEYFSKRTISEIKDILKMVCQFFQYLNLVQGTQVHSP